MPNELRNTRGLQRERQEVGNEPARQHNTHKYACFFFKAHSPGRRDSQLAGKMVTRGHDTVIFIVLLPTGQTPQKSAQARSNQNESDRPEPEPHFSLYLAVAETILLQSRDAASQSTTAKRPVSREIVIRIQRFKGRLAPANRQDLNTPFFEQC